MHQVRPGDSPLSQGLGITLFTEEAPRSVSTAELSALIAGFWPWSSDPAGQENRVVEFSGFTCR